MDKSFQLLIFIIVIAATTLSVYIIFDIKISLITLLSIFVLYFIALSISYINSSRLIKAYEKCLDISSTVCMFDRKNRFTFANPEFLKLVGIGKQELINVKTRSFLKEFARDPEYFDIVFKNQESKKAWSGILYFKMPYQPSIDTYTVTSLSIVPILDFWGTLKGSIFLFVPEMALDSTINELRNTNAISSNIDQLISITIEKNPELFMIISSDYTVQYSNWASFEEIPANLRSSKPYCYNIFKNLDKPCDNCQAKKVFETGIVNYSETGNLKLNKIFEVLSYPIKNASGEVIYVAQQLKDITDKAYMKRKIIHNMNELMKAKQDAEAENRSKSAFLANISHEFRTPLNGIIGFSAMLKSADIKDEYKEYVNIIEKSSLDLSKIINDILDYSWFGSAEVALKLEPFETYPLFITISENFRRIAPEKNINFASSYDSNLPSVLIGNLNGIQRVISNLLNNAIKFNNVGGSVSFNMKMLELKNNECKILFEVLDTGIGMPKKLKDTIYHPFSQGDNNIANKRASGIGMGLAIVSKYLTLMNSSIEVESEESHGSKFSFTLNLVVA